MVIDKNKNRKFKLSRLLNLTNSRYFLPGLKRWIISLIIGITCVIFGITLLLELKPFTFVSSLIWKLIHGIAVFIPAQISGPIILVLGLCLILSAIWFSLKIILQVAMEESVQRKHSGNTLEQSSILEALERSRRKGQGIKIVAIGGGTGLSRLLRGLKGYSHNISAIVTVADDGGSSGRLRKELQVIPPGDIRSCIVALSDEEELLASLFQYRFQQGSLKGHSLGNLFLAALSDLCSDDMAKATQLASRILRSSGQVLPSSLKATDLCAELEDGEVIEGESQISLAKSKIKRIFSSHDMPPALPESLDAVKEADLIILGPGSLYTSIIPNLLFPELVDGIIKSNACVLYVCNLTQDGETRGHSAIDCIEAIHNHTHHPIINSVLLNDLQGWDIPDQQPIDYNLQELEERQIIPVVKSRLQGSDARHKPLRLARSIIHWFQTRRRSNRQFIQQQ